MSHREPTDTSSHPRLRRLVAAALSVAAAACAPEDSSTDPTYTVDGGSSTGTVPDAGQTAPGVDAGFLPGTDASTPTITDAGAPTITDAGAPTITDAGAPTGTGPKSCTVDATTQHTSLQYGGSYACALWIANSAGKAVKAFEAHSESRHATLSGYPRAVASVSGLDAITGATVRGTINHHYTWDLKGPDGARVADGSYKLMVEIHSTSQNGTVNAPFTLGSAPVDASAADTNEIKSVHITCQ